jgi:hypothetical protein
MYKSTSRETMDNRQHTPIWFAALVANGCMARDRAVSWRCSSGKALYTNSGGDAEQIHPFGVSLRSGETLAVWWQPGETAYTLEVYNEAGIAAAA